MNGLLYVKHCTPTCTVCVACQYEDTVTFLLQAVEEEDKMTPEQLAIKNVGKQVKKNQHCCVIFILCCLFFIQKL